MIQPFHAALVPLTAGALFFAGALPSFSQPSVAEGPSSAQERSSPIQFRDAAKEAGLDFVLENHATPGKHMIETMAGGLAVFDYNGDGLALQMARGFRH